MSAPEKSAPALPCPAWCTTEHDRGSGISQHHMTNHDIGKPEDRTGWVTLLMVDYGDSALADSNGELDIHVNWRTGDDIKTVVRPLSEAAQLAETAEALGRDDVAALIRELAGLAAGTAVAEAQDGGAS